MNGRGSERRVDARRTRRSLRLAGAFVTAAALVVGLTACGDVAVYHRSLGVMDAWGDERAAVSVCRTPADFGQAEEFVDAPWYDCYDGSLRGFATSQGSLMCSTRITVRRRERVTIEVFRGRTLIAYGRFHSAVRDAVAFAAIRRGDVTSVPGKGLPPGSYRCRFYVGRQVVRDRRFTVVRSLLQRRSGAEATRHRR
jgi:hypothetical protein